jgi:hypothetical protein
MAGSNVINLFANKMSQSAVFGDCKDAGRSFSLGCHVERPLVARSTTLKVKPMLAVVMYKLRINTRDWLILVT